MRLLTLLICLALASIVSAEEPELYLMRGRIRSVTITPTPPASEKEIEKGLIDHSCAEESVDFEVAEYVSGKGEKRVHLTRPLASYNCQSSWKDAPVTDLLAMLSHWEKFVIFRGIVVLEEIEGEPGLLLDMGKFLEVHVMGGREIDAKKLFRKLKEPVKRHVTVDEGTDELKWLQEFDALSYVSSKVDLDEGCISGCNPDNVVPTYLVTYRKFIPLSRIRAFGY